MSLMSLKFINVYVLFKSHNIKAGKL